MGNIIEFLRRFMFGRRKKENNESYSRRDHPERLPVDQLFTVQDTEQKPKLLSTETIAPSNKCSDFYLACRNNDIEEFKKLFKTITLDEIDRLEPNGSTALHAACYNGHEEIVKLLLEAGADRAVLNKFQYLPFDEAKNDEIKTLFLRIPNTNRLVSNTGAIEWELINDDVVATAAVERDIIKSIYKNTSGFTTIGEMFEKIQKNYINSGLANFDGIDKIKRFFQKATQEQDPTWIIKAYTAETDFYKILNREIACGASHGQNERRYIIALLRHHPILDRLSFIGTAYRVMKINSDDLEKYHVDCSLMTKSFLSTSIDEEIAAWFLCQQELTLVPGSDRQRVNADGKLIKSWIMCKYKIKHRRTALHIENVSQYTNEGEILIMPYTVFKVNKVNKVKPSYLLDGQSITQIELEECDLNTGEQNT
jgi:hypothetical protein